jgi:hypothetical protein
MQRIKKCLNIITGASIMLLFGLLVAVSTTLVAPAVTMAAETPVCTDKNGDGKINVNDLDPQKPCRYTDELKSTPDAAAKTCTGGDCSGLIKNYVNPFIKFLTGLIGVVVTISIIVGGIQYSSAGGDPGKVAAAKKRIYNTLIALVAYIFMFAFLQWLIPGGIV